MNLIYAVKNNKRKTTEEFIVELKKLNPFIDVLGEYVNANIPIECKCQKCGYEWKPRPTNLISRKGSCPGCNNRVRYTSETFLRAVSEKNNTVEILDEFVNVNSYLKVRCKECGYEWQSKGENLLQGRRCPICSKQAGAKKKIMSEEKFKQRLKKNNPDIEIIGKFLAVTERVQVRCLLCGYEWNPIADNILRGKGCCKCGIQKRTQKRKFTLEEYASKLQNITSDISVIGEYNGTQNRVAVKCNVCGYEWSPVANALLRGSGCPKCAKTSTSFMEQFILAALQHAAPEITILSRDKTAIGKELDIYIPSKNYAVEIGAWYWHKKRVKTDEEKRKLCGNSGIKLLVIYDCVPHNLVCEKNSEQYFFDYSLSDEKDYCTLKKIIKYICLINKINFERLNDAWEKIENEATENSKMITTDEFIEQLKAKNSDIKICGKYQGSKSAIKCQCAICRYKWQATPYHLLNGTGCPKCAGRFRTHEEFMELFKRKGNRNVEIVGEYYNTVTKIRCRCKICGGEWDSMPYHILNGQACGKCNGGVKKKVRCINNNIIYDSLKEASIDTGVSISSICCCCNNKKKSVKGLSFEYVK